MKKAMTLGWLLCAVVSCGGKTAGDGSPGATGLTGVESQPAPGCSTICDRLVSLCAGSPNASCQSDCEATKTKYVMCPGELDRFLKCMGSTHVECTPGEVVVIDCSGERVDLERCGQ
jgi:hypothetical protein